MGNRGLQQVVAQDRRNVSVVEDAGLLPESRFVPVLLDSPAARQRWLADTVAASRKGDKYVFWHGLEAIWETGSSVLVYQHLPRESKERFIPRITERLAVRLPGSRVTPIAAACVVLFAAVQRKHDESVECGVKEALAGAVRGVAGLGQMALVGHVRVHLRQPVCEVCLPRSLHADTVQGVP